MDAISITNNVPASQAEAGLSRIEGRRASGSFSRTSFSALLAKSSRSLPVSEGGLGAENNTTGTTGQAAGTSTQTALATTTRVNPASTIVHSPFGTYDLAHLEAAKTLGDPAWEPMRLYFFTHEPKDYTNDTAKMAEFSRIYGARAVSVLNTWGHVPENVNVNLISTAAEKDLFREDGVRAYYQVSDLINMYPAERSKYVDISGEQLLNLFWSGNLGTKIQTKATATTSSTPIHSAKA
jgi:hypothetical protein